MGWWEDTTSAVTDAGQDVYRNVAGNTQSKDWLPGGGGKYDPFHANNASAWATSWGTAWGTIPAAIDAFKPKTDTPPEPNAPPPPPTMADASQTSINTALETEGRQRSASTILTSGGGAGLLDEPHTASRTLLGS